MTLAPEHILSELRTLHCDIVIRMPRGWLTYSRTVAAATSLIEAQAAEIAKLTEANSIRDQFDAECG